MFITRRALTDAGLDVTFDKHGLSIQGTIQMPDEVHEHVDAIANLMQFTPMDGDRLREHVASVGIWTALRNCPTEL